jgi:hypothetical protein
VPTHLGRDRQPPPAPARQRGEEVVEVVTPAQDNNAERRRELAEHAAQVRCLADELAAAIAKGLVLGLPIPGRVHGAWLAVDEWAELLGRSSAGLTSRGGRDQCCPGPTGQGRPERRP